MCLEEFRCERQVEVANILGDKDACPPVAHLEVNLDRSLAPTTVNAAGVEALAERVRIKELVLEVQQRLEGGARLSVGALGAGADNCRPQGADPVDLPRWEAPQDSTVAERVDKGDGRPESTLAAEDGPRCCINDDGYLTCK